MRRAVSRQHMSRSLKAEAEEVETECFFKIKIKQTNKLLNEKEMGRNYLSS